VDRVRRIAHRGNSDGRRPACENAPWYVLEALRSGYDAEVDVWLIDGKFILDHEPPQFVDPDRVVSLEFLQQPGLWCHAKNPEAASAFATTPGLIHWFWHEGDLMTLTSRGYIWARTDVLLFDRSVVVIADAYEDFEVLQNARQFYGICADDFSRLSLKND
jgi:hypothetical protein